MLPNHKIIGFDGPGANVTIIPTSPNVGDPYKYKYQGQEWQDELGLNTYAYQWRDYDPAIARFNKIDRFAEKYFDQTPYHFTRNNPLYFVDIAGDSLNVAQFRDYDKTANESLINDLQDKTGLSLETDDDGNVTYESKNGKPVIALLNPVQARMLTREKPKPLCLRMENTTSSTARRCGLPMEVLPIFSPFSQK